MWEINYLQHWSITQFRAHYIHDHIDQNQVPENITLKCNCEMYAEGVYILVHTHPQHILHNFSS